MNTVWTRHLLTGLAVTSLGLAVIGAQVPPINADVNGDCVVTRADVRIVKANLGKATPLPAADVNRDGRVNTTDLNFVMRLVGRTVCSQNRPPTASAGPDQQGIAGRIVLLDGRGSADPDRDPLTYEWAFLTAPDGSRASLTDAATASASFTPDLPGTFALRLTVRDGRGGSASDDVQVIVAAANRPPVIVTTAAVEAQAGQPYAYDVQATDPDDDNLVYSLPLAPDGMTIDAATGVVAWTPTAMQAGVRSARIRVDDQRGGVADQAFAIDVLAPVNRPPVATPDRYDVGLGQTLDVSPSGVLANDVEPEGRPLSARLRSMPGEGTLDFRPDGSFTYAARPLALPGTLDPVVEWRQSTFRVAPTSRQIMVTPVVIDANRDGVPEIYVPTHVGDNWRSVGQLRSLAGGATPVSHFNLVRLKNATLQVSSTYSNSFPRERAIDGDLQTSWFTARPDLGAYFQVTFPSAALVREIRMFGNRQFATGHDFLSGRFQLFDAGGAVLYDSGSVTLPAPDRDITVTLASPVPGVTRVRFTATGFEDPTDDHGFAELQVIGDAIADPGTELWTVGGEAMGSGGLAAADIDGDGFGEIIGQHRDGGLVAFEHDGTVKWRSAAVGLGVSGSIEIMGSPSITDLDGDGSPEIVVGSAVLNHDGTLRWGPKADTGNNGFGPVSVVADLDLDGRPEILTGRSAYRADGSTYWTSTRPQGFTAVGNFDLDPHPEIVVVSASGGVRLLEHDGQVKWGPVALPGGGRGGPPTIADVDADGQPEIGVAGSTRYVVFETDGTVKWQVETQDSSSNVTGSSVFDFEGDGRAEIVYADELSLRILRGSDGAQLYFLEKGSATLHELPTIADVDGDGRAEIVVGANDWSFGEQTGLFVIGGGNDDWVATRAIWNQHAYRITNVGADGSIPATEPHHWLVPGLNAFRTNGFAPGDPDRTTSFWYRASDGALESNDAVVHITIRQPNSPPTITAAGSLAAAIGVPFVFAPTVTDPDLGDTHTFTLDTRPDGMTIEPLTGLLRWTPDASQLGPHPVTVRVLDHRGLSDVQVFTVTVSQPVTVPDVTGRTQAAAQNAALAAGLTVPPPKTAYSLTVPVGSVIGQMPLPGTLVAPTTPLQLEVSAGLEPVTVPNVTGLTRAAATALLTSRGLVLGTVTLAASQSAPPDAVTAQQPAAGAVVGITTPVDVTVSTGPAIALTLARRVIQAGSSTTFAVEAYDLAGQPVVPLPAVTLTLTAAPGDTTGAPPVIAGNLITSGATTRGRFTVRATLPSGETASALLVVARPGVVSTGLYSDLDGVLGDLTGDLGRLESALLSGDLASIPALRTALVATRARMDVTGLAGVAALAPEGGFLPTPAELTTAGFPETPADVAWNTALRDLIATLQATEAVYAQLSTTGPADDDARLLALGSQMEARVAALLAVRPTLHGVVKRANVVNQLVSVRIPRLIDAQVSAVERALRDGGLAATLQPLDRFYAGLSLPTSGDAVDPTAYYGRRQQTFFTLPSLMRATSLHIEIIRKIYAPILGEVVTSAGIVVANDLARRFLNAGSLVGVVTGASVSFNVFDMPGSVIEGFGFDRDFPDGNQVFIVGPLAVSTVTELINGIGDRPEDLTDIDALNDYFKGIADAAQSFGESVFDPQNMTASGLARGCIFDASTACSQLVYDNGFTSVHTSGSFPAPVLFIVRNPVTGSWGTVLANFLPADRPE